MSTKIAKELIEKYQAGTATPDEIALIEKWVMLGTVKELDLSDEELASDFSTIRNQLPLKYERKQVKLWPRIAAAIAIVFCIGLGYSIYLGQTTEGFRLAREYRNDIKPGKNTAIITLPDGTAIPLSDTKTGVVIGDELKYNDNSIVISNEELNLLNSTDKRSLPDGRDDGKVQTLTASTPRGGTYQVVLPDGTKVWLNADSKLRFLSDYRNKAQRIVQLTGEAYFEVTTAYTSLQGRRTKQPFLVLSNGQRIEVLGTHFNVSVYPGDPVATTTLLEGSITLNKTLLKPNQQAERMGKGGLIISNVNGSQAIAWKNGEFVFEGEALESIMRKVARWYDIEVTYAANAPKEFTLSGVVSRTRNISAVLERMESTGKVKFKIEGRKVTVTK
jgi:transmembrane sensor